MKKHKVTIGIELIVFMMIIGTLVSYAAGSNPPSNGVKYTNNGQTTVQGALNDLYDKVGNTLPTRTPDTSVIAVGGSRTYAYGTYPRDFTVSCANRTCPSCPTCESQGYGQIKTDTFQVTSSSGKTINLGFKPRYLFITHANTGEGTLNWVYNADISTSYYSHGGSWKTLGQTGKYMLKINADGFTINNFSNTYTLRYVAII